MSEAKPCGICRQPKCEMENGIDETPRVVLGFVSMSTRATAKKTYSLREYIAAKVDGHSITSLARASGEKYDRLYRHVKHHARLDPAVAKRLAAWSGGVIDFEKTLGVA